MKKIISILLAMAMLMCGVNAQAAVVTLFQALTAEYYTGVAETEFSMQLNRPMTFLGRLNSEMGPLKPVDLQQLAESAFGLKDSAMIAYDISEDYSEIAFSAETELNLPVELNDNLKADIWAQVGIWFEMNTNDVNKPVYNVILKMPFSDNYLVIDYGDLLSGGMDIDTMDAYMEKVDSPEYMEELNAFVIEQFKTHFQIKEQRLGKEYLITASDAQFKDYIGDVMDKSLELAEEMMGEEASEAFGEDFHSSIDEFGEKLRSIPFLGKDGMKIKVTVSGKKIVSVQCDMHICVNIYDIMEAFGEDVVQYNRDEWYVDFTLNTKTQMSRLGDAVKIEMPELNADNSADVWDINGGYGYGRTEIYTGYDIKADATGRFMLPLRDCMASLNLTTDEYDVTDGKVTVSPADEDSFVAKAVMEIGSNKMLVNGNEKTLTQRLEMRDDGMVLIPADAVGCMISSDVSYVRIVVDDNAVNTLYFEPVEPDTMPDMDALIDYEGMYLPDSEENAGMYVSSYIGAKMDGFPYVSGGVVYLPIEDFMQYFGVTLTSRNGKTVTVTAPEEHPKEFDKIEFLMDSKDVVIDGIKHTMSNPAVSVNGVEYMPVDFLGLIDCQANNINYSFASDSYRVSVYRNAYQNDISPTYDDYETMYEYKTLRVMIYEPIVVDKGVYYLPLRPLMGELMVRDENIIVDGEKVTVIAHTPQTGFEKLTIDGTLVNIDGKEYNIPYPVKDVNGTTYVPSQFVTEVLGGDISDISVVYGERPNTEYSVRIKNPLYVPAE